MSNHEEKDVYKKKRPKNSTKNVTEEVIYNELFITKIPNQKYYSKIFITDCSSMLHMVNSEENMTNYKD